jgi:tetratricopeptide (TPR) repeat protein
MSVEKPIQGEVLLRIGSLSSKIGAKRGLSDVQERARDLLTEAVEIFRAYELKDKEAEALHQLALTYYKDKSFDDALALLEMAIPLYPAGDSRAIALMDRGVMESDSKRYESALEYYAQARPFIQTPLTEGLHLNGTAINQKRLGRFAEARMSYSGAAVCFELAGHLQYQGAVENNIGGLLLQMGLTDEAREHLDRAEQIFRSINDERNLAEVRDTRWSKFSLEEELHRVEAKWIEKALTESEGNKAEAARLLGISKQSLHERLNRRFSELRAGESTVGRTS